MHTKNARLDGQVSLPSAVSIVKRFVKSGVTPQGGSDEATGRHGLSVLTSAAPDALLVLLLALPLGLDTHENPVVDLREFPFHFTHLDTDLQSLGCAMISIPRFLCGTQSSFLLGRVFFPFHDFPFPTFFFPPD